jgi:Putative metallopeptidase
MKILRVWPFCAMLGVLLTSGGAAFGQTRPPGTPSLKATEEEVRTFQGRIEAVARSIQNSPTMKNLTERQRIDRVEFVLGNTLFILLHELGHVHFSEMKIPVLGHEEDEADTFAVITMLRVGSGFSERVLTNASQGWFFNARRDQQTGAMPLYYDEHELSPQRAFNIVCLMVGADPVKYKHLADDAKMPESRQKTCKRDYEKAARSWEAVLEPHRRAPEQPEITINVSYGDADGVYEKFASAFRALRLLETVAERSAALYAWDKPFSLQMLSCDGPNASWDDETRILKICYQLSFDFAQLYQAYVALPPAPQVAAASQKPKRKAGKGGRGV